MVIHCESCGRPYDGKLEDHLITYHITDNQKTARYIAYLVERIEALERAQKT